MQDLLTVDEIRALFGVTNTGFYIFKKEPGFPTPAAVRKRFFLYRRDELDAFFAARGIFPREKEKA